jgi:hypothetical protein
MHSFCAHHAPHYTAQALRARDKRAVVLPHAFGLRSIVAGWTSCATSMASAAAARTATTTMHSQTHRRLRQPLRRQRCTARPRFTRPVWPRRALRSHHQRDSGETRFFNTTRADYKKSLGRIFGAATPLGALVSVRVSVLVANGSLDLAARAIVLQAFLCHLAIQDAATEFHCAGQMHRARDACAVGCHSLVSRVEIHHVTEQSTLARS